MNRFVNCSLSNSIFNDNIEEVIYLLNKGISCHIQDNTGRTPLHYAVEKNRLDMVELLLAQPDIKVNVRCYEGETALFHACFTKCDYKMIYALLIAGSDPNLPNNEQITPLHVVSDVKCAELLLSFGANVNLCDFNKYTPLHSAVEKNNVSLVDFLLNSGADTDLRELNGLNPLMLSFQHNFSAIDKLVEFTKNINAIANDGWSALMLAINSGKIDVAFQLIKRGADVNVEAENITPIHLAVMRQEEELFNTLWFKIDRKSFKKLQNLPHLMLIHRWYVPERLKYFLNVLDVPVLFSNEKKQRTFLEFLFRFERDNKLELALCDIFTHVANVIAPAQISTCLLICFLDNFSTCQYKNQLLDILIQKNVANFDNKIFSLLAIECDPEMVPKLLTLTLSINPNNIFCTFTRNARMDKAILKLLLHLLSLSTPINKQRLNLIDKLKKFNPYSAKRVKYTVTGADVNPMFQMRRIVDYEITPNDREVMCNIYVRLNSFINVSQPQSLREMARDCVRNKINSTRNGYKQSCQLLKNLLLPKDIVDIILLRNAVNNL